MMSELDALREGLVVLGISDPPAPHEHPTKYIKAGSVSSLRALLAVDFRIRIQCTFPSSFHACDRLALFCHTPDGCALLQHKPLPRYHTFIANTGRLKTGTPEARRSSERSSPGSNGQFFYCFCYTSYFPVSSSTRRMMQELLPADVRLPSELYEPYFFVILSKWPYHATFSKLLRSVFDFYLDAHVMLTPKELGERLNAVIGGSPPLCIACGSRVQFSVPYSTELPLVDVNFCVLLERLSMSDLVTVLTVLLHERQVVVYSSHVEVIAPVVESIRALLFPFQWPHLYIPFLPAAYASVCSADVPYIVGMLRETWDNLNDYPGSVTFVNIDSGTISGDVSERLPRLPKASVEALREAIDDVMINMNLNGVNTSSVFMSARASSPVRGIEHCLSETGSLSAEGDSPLETDDDESDGLAGSSLSGRFNRLQLRHRYRSRSGKRLRRSQSAPALLVVAKEPVSQGNKSSTPTASPRSISTEHCLSPRVLTLGRARTLIGTNKDSIARRTCSADLPRGSSSPTLPSLRLSPPLHFSNEGKSSAVHASNKIRWAFLEMFMDLFQWYRMYMTDNEENKFDAAAFLAAISPGEKEFMRAFLETTLFKNFVSHRFKTSSDDCFEHRLQEAVQRSMLENNDSLGIEGFMFKRGSLVPSWKRRYFVVGKDAVLRYYRGEVSRSNLKGEFELRVGETEVEIPHISGRFPTAYPFELRSSSGKSLLMCAPDDETRARWVSFLRRTLRVTQMKTILRRSVLSSRRRSALLSSSSPVPCVPGISPEYARVMSEVDSARLTP